MKTAAAILAAAMLFQEPDKVELFWNPPADRVVVVSLSGSMSVAGVGLMSEVKAEAELHPKGEAGKDGRPFLLRGTRYFLKLHKTKDESEFLYERGKQPVTKGRVSLSDQAIDKMKEDIPIRITDRGLRHADSNFDEVFEQVSTGTVQLQLPPVPVKVGSSWVSTTGFPFKGKLRYTVRSIARGKSARIEVQFLPDEFSKDENPPAGNGELTFTFGDGLISSSTFTMTRKNLEGKVVPVFQQTLTQKLKP